MKKYPHWIWRDKRTGDDVFLCAFTTREKALAYTTYRGDKRRWKLYKVTSKSERLQAELTQSNQLLESKRAEVVALQAIRDQLAKTNIEIRSDRNHLLERLAKKEAELAQLRAVRDELLEQKAAINDNFVLASWKTRAEQLEANLEDVKADRAHLLERLAEKEVELAEALKRVQKAEDHAKYMEENWAGHRYYIRVQQLEAELAQLRAVRDAERKEVARALGIELEADE